MKLTAACAWGFLVCAASLQAQESVMGRYNGTFVARNSRGVTAIGLELEITGATDGKLQGKATRYASSRILRGCEGEYKVAGRYKGEKIDMRSVERGGPAKDCSMVLHLVAEGRKLKGTMNGFEVELTK